MRNNFKYFFTGALAVYLLLFNLLPATFNLIQILKNSSSKELKTCIVFSGVDAENEEKEEERSKSSKSYEEEVEVFIMSDFALSYLLLNNSSIRFPSNDEKLQTCCIQVSTPPPNQL